MIFKHVTTTTCSRNSNIRAVFDSVDTKRKDWNYRTIVCFIFHCMFTSKIPPTETGRKIINESKYYSCKTLKRYSETARDSQQGMTRRIRMELSYYRFLSSHFTKYFKIRPYRQYLCDHSRNFS